MENIEKILTGITVNTQSSIRLTDGTKVLYADPLEISGEPHDADLIFITHAHGDHFSPADIAKLVKNSTVLVAPESMADQVRDIADGRQVVAVVPGKAYEADGVAFETVPAYNKLKPFHPKKNVWVGYVVTVDGARVYIAGDTDATSEAAAVRCDIALVPVGGTYTTTASEAAALVNRMKPAVAIPIHYGTIVGKPGDGDKFAGDVDPEITVVKKLS